MSTDAIKCLVRQSDGVILAAAPTVGDPPHDPATETVLVLDRAPDPRAERYDGVSGLRAATAQEIADYDAAEAAAQERSFVETRVLRALVRVLAPKLAMTAAALRDEVLAEYRRLT